MKGNGRKQRGAQGGRQPGSTKGPQPGAEDSQGRRRSERTRPQRRSPEELGPRVVADGVTKRIGEVTLLAPTSMKVPPGTCLVVRGPNGAGKTTLLRILAGTLEPTEGTVRIDDRPADERDPVVRARVAALLGAPTAYRDLTLADHLTLVDSTWGRDPATCATRVTDGLALLEIDHLATRFPHELSSGQGQLFRLALTFFRPSELLVLDEPEQRLDTDKRALVADLIAERRDAGTTVVMACHDPAMTDAVADHVLAVDPAEP
ncbi:ABC transporter ATP-binding protein, partial [Nostocoides japonicum]|uniref:ABC transporter ATP-binding protein n=1 Tax=Nostocoides japonicum TaxID=99481 RepID=UPI001F380DA2